MPMPSYSIYCTNPGCKNLAVYKIASIWSDGVQRELKTYSLACGDCLAPLFRQGRDKQIACHLTQSETLDPPGIFHMEPGLRDKQLHRLEDVERRLLNAKPVPDQ